MQQFFAGLSSNDYHPSQLTGFAVIRWFFIINRSKCVTKQVKKGIYDMIFRYELGLSNNISASKVNSLFKSVRDFEGCLLQKEQLENEYVGRLKVFGIKTQEILNLYHSLLNDKQKDAQKTLEPGAQRTFRLSSRTPRLPFNARTVA